MAVKGIKVKLKVNKKEDIVTVFPGELLLDTLRNRLGLTGTKRGCGEGECGACTVLIDGKPVLACLTLTMSVEGRDIETIEYLSQTEEGKKIQKGLVENGGIQCGFCTPGVVVSSVALFRKVKSPDEALIKEALSGNLCRCTGYIRIIDALKSVAK